MYEAIITDNHPTDPGRIVRCFHFRAEAATWLKREVVIGHDGEHVRNGLGEWIA